MSQVSDLQAKLEQMAKDSAEARERPESYDSNGSKPPTTPKASSRRGQVVNMQEGIGLGEAFVFDEISETQKTNELERLKAKLKEHQDNNAEISNRIKRIREKHKRIMRIHGFSMSHSLNSTWNFVENRFMKKNDFHDFQRFWGNLGS